MKNSKGRGLLRLALLLVLVALAGFFGYGYMDDIKLGLDLAGGVSITYQAKDENPSAEDMKDTIYKLQQRGRFTRRETTALTSTFQAFPMRMQSWRSLESRDPWYLWILRERLSSPEIRCRLPRPA